MDHRSRSLTFVPCTVLSKDKGDVMTSAFKQFVSDEVEAIMSSMTKECLNDPALCCTSALAWIEKNAEEYRNEWTRLHATDEISAGNV